MIILMRDLYVGKGFSSDSTRKLLIVSVLKLPPVHCKKPSCSDDFTGTHMQSIFTDRASS